MSKIKECDSEYSMMVLYSRLLLGDPEVQKSHDDLSVPSHQRALSLLCLLVVLEVPVFMQSIFDKKYFDDP